MSQEPVIMNGGESPLASQLQSGVATSSQLQSGATQFDGGAAPTSQTQLSPSTSSTDPSGVATSGGIMRPRSG
jgi:hypothetical protein